MTDSDLYDLEFLSLVVAKITQEINNYTRLNDKTLAEFVISLDDQSKTFAEFKGKLQKVSANFREFFIENVDRLISTLHRKHKKKPAGKVNAVTDGPILDEADKKKRLFPGLALQDQEWESGASHENPEAFRSKGRSQSRTGGRIKAENEGKTGTGCA
uniref:Chitin synthase 8 (Myosin chitin synthase 1)) n=1 Tax=Ganoderma boninense TaxID=34458 RepID=A0A5K1K4W7_9APHY|nr:Chitin synthase 8 (EC (Chitin-UDP acetyl-glucosaminyl transferase 8) (Myosin chitin synthase 1) [Ganoderma boninense]